ncbi:RNA methyltransferase [Peptostreptococcus stomatis]|uniref:TrmH family RNA methyltransferase n=1 Tax=Peptostreptococcus stomatis TaxID=341694 RepID=UPI0028DD2006|nr:RNA methyltransferase [Peptostreptococcus stomatis]
MTYIKSKDNEKFKAIKSLLVSKKRYKEKKYLAEGLRTVELALEHGADIDMVILRDGSEFDLDLRVHTLSKDLYDQVSDTENSQGIMAVVKMRDLSKEDFDPSRHRKVLVLDRLQDPGNVGTIIRTADAMGFDLICMAKGCVDVYNPKVVRSAMGSGFYMDILLESQEAILSILKGAGLQIVSSSLDTDNYYDEVTYGDGCALVLGNEANGINDFWIENSDLLVKIPMYGKAESFNVAISAALLMSKVIKRKNK